MALHGPFHRLQGADLNELIERSRRVWGRPARNVFQTSFPAVKAFVGPLPEGRSGIEFYTPIEPSASSTPTLALWYRGEPGVCEVSGEDAVWIPVAKISRRID